MTPVDQRVIPDPERGDGHSTDGVAGDCQRAAIASVMDAAHEEVPHFVGFPHPEDDPLAGAWGERWWREQRRWLFSQGMDCTILEDDALHTVLHDADWHKDWEGHVVVAGPSPRGAFTHAVVGYLDCAAPAGERLTLVHDPHPSRAFLDGEPTAVDVVHPYEGAALPPAEQGTVPA